MKDLRAFLLCTTALRRPDVFRVVVDGVLLTPRQRVERAIAREWPRIQPDKSWLLPADFVPAEPLA